MLIKTYVEIDERAKILVMMVKYWAKRRELNDGTIYLFPTNLFKKAARGGTLSSYTWTLIVINFLQMRNPPVLPCLQEIHSEMAVNGALSVETVIIDQIDCSFFDDLSALSGFGKANTESIGLLLYRFFEHFAFEFDFNRSVVSVRYGKYLSKIEKGWHEGKSNLG
jgi:DNA polymerase sigma